MSAVTLWTYEYMVWNRLWDLRGGDYQVLVRHCNILQHTATHCNTLQHTANTATHCNTMQHSTTHCIILQHTATHCNTLPHTATHWNTLQHTTTHCNTLQNTATHRGGDYQVLIIRYAVDCYTDIAVCCSVLQCVAVCPDTATHCNTLQHTATHCNTLLYRYGYRLHIWGVSYGSFCWKYCIPKIHQIEKFKFLSTNLK